MHANSSHVSARARAIRLRPVVLMYHVVVLIVEKGFSNGPGCRTALCPLQHAEFAVPSHVRGGGGDAETTLRGIRRQVAFVIVHPKKTSS